MFRSIQPKPKRSPVTNFETALRSSIESLLKDPGVNGHFHFDEPAFTDLVPPFESPEWVGLAAEIAAIGAEFDAPVLLYVPLCTTASALPVDLDALKLLGSWEPPALYAITGSSFDLRKTSAWYSDDVAQVDGACGWLTTFEDEDETELGRPAFRTSLIYETYGRSQLSGDASADA